MGRFFEGDEASLVGGLVLLAIVWVGTLVVRALRSVKGGADAVTGRYGDLGLVGLVAGLVTALIGLVGILEGLSLNGALAFAAAAAVTVFAFVLGQRAQEMKRREVRARVRSGDRKQLGS